MSEDKNAVRPKGVSITITDTQQVVVTFDHGEVPDIVLSPGGAKRVASHIASAAGRVETGFSGSKYTEGANDK